ncbi:MAG: NAD(P)-dependent oxidoreductase [Thermodesulfobacteriota bacterium]
MNPTPWRIYHPEGNQRVIVTRELPGDRWLTILLSAGCRVEIWQRDAPPSAGEILAAIGSRCDAAIGQLTEEWGDPLLAALRSAGGSVYGNYAVGFNNVDLDAATRRGLPVGNTPGVLTEATAEMAVTLTLAAARRAGEAERFLRAGRFSGWRPDLFLGELLWRKTLGIIGAGRIGSAYARMMIEGHKMNLIYFSPRPNLELETYAAAYGDFLLSRGMERVSCRRADTVEEVLRKADCVSLHTVLNSATRHLINSERLAMMKPHAVLINTSRGAVIDEAALVHHCKNHPGFRAGLDVFENEPVLSEGLADLENVVLVPHIASATRWTREGMALLSALNVVAVLRRYPVWNRSDVTPFLTDHPPLAAPGIVNAEALGMPLYPMAE